MAREGIYGRSRQGRHLEDRWSGRGTRCCESYWLCGDDKPSDKTLKQTAYLTCQDFVKDRLKSPSSARFPTWRLKNIDKVSVKKGDETFVVESYVDAKNAFGVVLRKDFACKIKVLKGGTKWQLLNLSM